MNILPEKKISTYKYSLQRCSWVLNNILVIFQCHTFHKYRSCLVITTEFLFVQIIKK